MTCKSMRVSKFIDGRGSSRVFCRNCWISFPEGGSNQNDPRRGVHVNFAALRGDNI